MMRQLPQFKDEEELLLEEEIRARRQRALQEGEDGRGEPRAPLLQHAPVRDEAMEVAARDKDIVALYTATVIKILDHGIEEVKRAMKQQQEQQQEKLKNQSTNTTTTNLKTPLANNTQIYNQTNGIV